MKQPKSPDGIVTEIRPTDPHDLVLLATNARFMQHDQYQRLVENIRRDRALTSTPLVAQIYEDHDPGKPTSRYEVLSGNHRTQAAIDAGLTTIFAMFVDQYLAPDERVALQLSHNAIAGQDDPGILKQLYESIEDIDLREYAGLDDKILKLLDSVQPGSLAEANLEYQSLSIVFFPDELEAISETVNLAIGMAKSADKTYLARLETHDRILEALTDIGAAYNVSNVASGLDLIMDVFDRHRDEIEDGWWDSIERIPKHDKWVPVNTVTGVKAPPEDLGVIRRAIEKGRHGDSSIPGWKILAQMARDYLDAD
jgi:hypothetical protein